MKLFKCQACGQVLLFENTRCEKCARRLGYSPEANRMTALDFVVDSPELSNVVCLRKPFRPNELLRAIEEALSRIGAAQAEEFVADAERIHKTEQSRSHPINPGEQMRSHRSFAGLQRNDGLANARRDGFEAVHGTT